MPSRLQYELQQTKPFPDSRQELMVQLSRTTAVLTHGWEQHLRPHGITLTQFNVLRILRGAGEGGLCRHQVAARLVTPVPDVTRLLDRMVRDGLVTRSRGDSDRRVVKTCITAAGLEVLRDLDVSALTISREKLGHLSDEDVDLLNRLLEAVRYPPECPEALPLGYE